MTLSFHRRAIVRFLLGFIGFLLIAGIISAAVRIKAAGGYWLYVFMKFDLDGNWNMVVWFSSLTLLLAAALAWWIGKATHASGGSRVRHWYWLAVILTLMAVDAAIDLHGLLNYPMRTYVVSSNTLFFAWVIPGLFFVIVVVAIYLKMVLALPRPVMRRVLTAGAVFVAGAVGMEVASGMSLSYFIDQPWVYQACASLEEVMEMIGVVILIDGFLLHLAGLTPHTDLHLT